MGGRCGAADKATSSAAFAVGARARVNRRIRTDTESSRTPHVLAFFLLRRPSSSVPRRLLLLALLLLLHPILLTHSVFLLHRASALGQSAPL